jgi:hypothetical protein
MEVQAMEEREVNDEAGEEVMMEDMDSLTHYLNTLSLLELSPS